MTARTLLALSWLSGFNCRAPLLATGPLLPLMIRDLDLSATMAGALTGLPLFVMAATSIPGGLLVDRIGARSVLIAAQLGVALAGGLRGVAPDYAALLVLVALLGGGIGLSQPALARVAQMVLPGRATFATAVYVNGLITGVLAGTALSATALLALAGPTSWRGVFALWGLCAVGSGAGWAAAPAEWADPAAVRAAIRPSLPRSVPGLLPIAVACAAQAVIFYAAVTWMPEFYVLRGWTVAAASLPLAAVSVSSVAVSFLTSGLVTLARGFRRPLALAAAITVAGQAGLVVAPGPGVLWGTLIGAGTSLAFALCLAAVADLAPADRVGASTGLILTVGHMSAVLGPLVLGVVRDLSGGFEAGWLVLIAAGGILAAAALRVPAGLQHRRQEAAG